MAKGVLLLNLGSPEEPTSRAVRKYLHEFLMDPYVIDIPAALRWILVRGLIVPARAKRVAAAYKSVWTKDGSPLTHNMRTFAAAVRANVKSDYDVRWAMRYGRPGLRETVKNWAVNEVLIVPLYPQYAESSTRTGVEAAQNEIRRALPKARIEWIQDFHSNEEFIEPQADLIRRHIHSFQPERLILSFHGLPIHHLTKIHPEVCFQSSDCCATLTEKNRLCYRAQTFATARELRERLPMAQEHIHVSYQSRLGRRPWIQPFTDHLVSDLAKQGVKRVLVSCPSFIADCLETLEEVGFRLREQFRHEGGEDLRLVPALNADPAWVESFSSLLKKSTKHLSLR